MAIRWSQKVREEGTHRENWEPAGETTHEGLVIREFRKDTRVMSDIYSIERYAEVWNPDENRTETVHVGGAFECNTRSGDVTVDIAGEHLAAYEAEVERQAELQRQFDAEKARKRALRRHNSPERGKTMRVIRGRKVPKGTEGIVFWIGNGRAGLALDDEKDDRGFHKNVAWVNAEYLENVEPMEA